MRSVFAAGVAVVLLTAGCQSSDGPEYSGWIGKSAPGPEVELSGFEPPEKLAIFRLQGEMDFPDRKMRVFRYQHDQDAERKLDVALYPLSPGWSDKPGERLVAGHYGTVKQSMAERLTKRHDSDIELVSEKIRQPDEQRRPVAEGVFREITDQWTRTLVLQVSTREPVFVRVTADFPDDDTDNRVESIRAATEAFLTHETKTADANGE